MARGPIPDKPRDRPTVPEVMEMARRYEGGLGDCHSWGCLHLSLEDRNLEDHFLEHERDRAAAGGDPEAKALAAAMLAMTRTQRRKLYAILHAPRGRLLFEAAIVIDGVQLHPNP